MSKPLKPVRIVNGHRIRLYDRSPADRGWRCETCGADRQSPGNFRDFVCE